jgi:hypothetical protein
MFKQFRENAETLIGDEIVIKKAPLKISLLPLSSIDADKKLPNLPIATISVSMDMTIEALKKYIFKRLGNEIVSSEKEIMIYFKADFIKNDCLDMKALDIKSGGTLHYCKC